MRTNKITNCEAINKPNTWSNRQPGYSKYSDYSLITPTDYH